MSIFGNTGNAAFSEGGNYLNPGHRYLLEQLKFEARHNRKGIPVTITEWRVHESDDPKIRPGAQASWVPNMTHELSLGNVMLCVAAVKGIDPNDKDAVKREITTQVLELCASPVQPLKGKMVEVVTEQITTKEKGQPFTKHRWIPTTKGPNLDVMRGTITPAASAAPPVPSAPAVPAVPAVPPVPQVQWLVHPQNPAYEYRPDTGEYRERAR
jgi:hypothetical protein